MPYNMIYSTENCTVVSEYEPVKTRSSDYQSEAALEESFINQLVAQGYERLHINDAQGMEDNLRIQMEKLNAKALGGRFSDSEWKRFFSDKIAKKSEGILEKTKKIQQDYIQILERDDGSIVNIKLIDKDNIHNNSVQVLNQYVMGKADGAKQDTRYDVTVLVNGLPMVHIELKRRGVPIRQAFNQIDRYQRDSFWASSGLYEYVQLFVISNGTHTKYYSNTTRWTHIQAVTHKRNKANGFEFTSYWADAQNKRIEDLVDFTRTFMTKTTLLNILTKYCILNAENVLMVMRPYQITATEKILNKIEIAESYKVRNGTDAGGYIWHTTGSGKTLTSFKTAQMATQLPYVDKVLFVVDRKDLDYQTIKEYDRFEKGAANGNNNTRVLARQLGEENARIIVTTIQKLDRFVRDEKNKSHPIFNKHVVMIFDECHRSQFGDMHQRITKKFKNYNIFGFTGTPIKAENCGNGVLCTTEQAFGNCIHTYTIVDAINDENVLPFKVTYMKTIAKKQNMTDDKVEAIDTREALEAPERIEMISQYILDHFNQKTMSHDKATRFNSMFAVDSIPMCKKYYLKLRELNAQQNRGLKIATIFSFAPNEAQADSTIEDECMETDQLDQSSRDFLEMAISNYNAEFGTNYDTSADSFQSYYKDLSMRVKNKEVDLLIVVNMFLTGFDAPTLNTLWVDKNLQMHGLIQAFSRTNRIYNSVKKYGNIVCFRDLEDATKKAIEMFGDTDHGPCVLIRPYDDYYNGYEEDEKEYPGYIDLVKDLLDNYPLGQTINQGKAEHDFLKLFGKVLRAQNILSTFDEFDEKQKILVPREMQDYMSIYQDIRDRIVEREHAEQVSILDDIEFEMELIKQIEVNIDYILGLIEKCQCGEDREVVIGQIHSAVNSSSQLRSKKALIDAFLNSGKPVSDWAEFIKKQKTDELNKIIADENLKAEETKEFVKNAFKNGELKTIGNDIDEILPKMSRFGGKRKAKKEKVAQLLSELFERYYGLIDTVNLIED